MAKPPRPKRPPKLCRVFPLVEPGKPLLPENILLFGVWSDGSLRWKRPGGQWMPVP